MPYPMPAALFEELCDFRSPLYPVSAELGDLSLFREMRRKSDRGGMGRGRSERGGGGGSTFNFS